jgi:hypothetical protein
LHLLSSAVRVSISSVIWNPRSAPRNVHKADGWDGVLKPVVTRYQGKVSRIYFRADAGFANPDVYEFLEAEQIKYAIRLPANRILPDRIGYLPKRAVGRPSNEVTEVVIPRQVLQEILRLIAELRPPPPPAPA